jgi:RNA polymerase sigma-70 factor, ECF subfamily
LAALPPDHREVVALVLVEGMSYSEAAELLEVPVGTVTSRLARARATLQAHLGKDQ